MQEVRETGDDAPRKYDRVAMGNEKYWRDAMIGAHLNSGVPMGRQDRPPHTCLTCGMIWRGGGRCVRCGGEMRA